MNCPYCGLPNDPNAATREGVFRCANCHEWPAGQPAPTLQSGPDEDA